MFEIVTEIIKLLDQIGVVRDRKTRFNTVFIPAYQDMILVHNAYLQLFTETSRQLPVFNAERQSWFINNPNYDESNLLSRSMIETKADSEEYRNAIRQSKGNLVTGGDRFEGQRDLIRYKAQAFLDRKLNYLEKGFVFAITSYFVQPEKFIPKSTDSNGVIDAIVERGESLL